MHRSQTGFTLLEALTTLAVMALLLGLALPSMSSTLSRSAISASHNQLMSGFASARQYAVFNRRLTLICPGTPETGCRNDSLWSQGWIVFVDRNGNDRYDITDTLVRAENALPGSVIALSTHGRPRAVFRPNGTSAGSNLTLRLCDSHEGRPKAAIVLNNTGRARSAQPNELAALPACG